MTSRSYRPVWLLLAVLSMLQACYAGVFIYRSSFIVEGRRYFCLFDDAMISMRYAHNWAHGHGLVWNPGERVEGYTNFAWTLLLGLCHLFNLQPQHMSLLVQVLGVPVLWSCLVATLLLAKACRLLPISAVCALILAASYYNLCYFSLLGMETAFLYTLITLGLCEAAKAIHSGEGRIGGLIWFAPAVLVRMDAVLITCYAFIFLVFAVRRHRLRVLTGFGIVLAVLLAHFVWRHHYYGQWLPNTYYLKVMGWAFAERIESGVMKTGWTGVQFGLPLLIGSIAMLHPKRWQFLLAGSFMVLVGYQVYVGGDAWSLNRLVIPAAGGVFVLTAEGIHRLLTMVLARRTRMAAGAFRAALAGLCILTMNGLWWKESLLLAPPYMTEDNRLNTQLWLAVEKVADRQALVAVGYAGVIPYYSQRRCVDLLGKCDPHIAHLPADKNIVRPGHNKLDLGYSLSQYEPDVVLHALCDGVPRFGRAYRPLAVKVDNKTLTFAVRVNSPHVRIRPME